MGGRRVGIAVGGETEARLMTTCFRGRQFALAGNFFRWESSVELFGDDFVATEIAKYVTDPGFEPAWANSLTIGYRAAVGWTSTVKRSLVPDADLEPFQPNRRSTALIVRPGRRLAPLTRYLTVIFQKPTLYLNQTTLVVRSVYPDEDVGELRGDLTEREGIVFFAWTNPGEPVPS